MSIHADNRLCSIKPYFQFWHYHRYWLRKFREAGDVPGVPFAHASYERNIPLEMQYRKLCRPLRYQLHFPSFHATDPNFEMTLIRFKLHTHLSGCITADLRVCQRTVVFESNGRNLWRAWDNAAFLLALHRLATENVSSCDSNSQSHTPHPST